MSTEAATIDRDAASAASDEESFGERVTKTARRAQSGIEEIIRSRPAASLLVAAGVSATFGALAGYLLARD